MAFVYTQLAEDLFQRPDENPLDPANWTQADSPDETLAVVGDLCVQGSGDPSSAGNEFYTGVSFPNNQYAEFTIGADWDNTNIGGEGAAIYLQTHTDESSSAAVLLVSIDADTIGFIVLDVNNDPIFEAGPLPNPTIGDVYRLEIFGLNIIGKINGTIIGTGSVTTLNTSPLNIIGLAIGTTNAVSAFRAGSITQTGGGSAPVSGNINSGEGFAALIKTPKTSVMGTNLGTRIIG